VAALLLVARANGSFSPDQLSFCQAVPAHFADRIASPQSVDLRAGVAPFCVFVSLVVVFVSNAVNLTDAWMAWRSD